MLAGQPAIHKEHAFLHRQPPHPAGWMKSESTRGTLPVKKEQKTASHAITSPCYSLEVNRLWGVCNQTDSARKGGSRNRGPRRAGFSEADVCKVWRRIRVSGVSVSGSPPLRFSFTPGRVNLLLQQSSSSKCCKH